MANSLGFYPFNTNIIKTDISINSTLISIKNGYICVIKIDILNKNTLICIQTISVNDEDIFTLNEDFCI